MTSLKITVGQILLLQKWKTLYKTNSGLCQNFLKSLSESHEESMYVIVYSSVFWIHLCVICQILGYGMLQIPLLIQHKNAASVGCSLEIQMFCKTAVRSWVWIIAHLMKPSSCLIPGQTCTVVFGLLLAPDQSICSVHRWPLT